MNAWRFWCVLFTFASLAQAEDWPHWRGPTRNGLTTEQSGWTKDRWLPEKAVWQRSVGIGASSPLVVGTRAYLLGHVDGKDTVRCLNTADGKDLWTQRYACKEYGRYHMGDEGIYSGPSSTPEYDPTTKLLFTLSIDGHLNCWDTTQEGKNVWQRNLYDDYKVGRRPKLTRAPQRDYGYSSSPLVYDNWLLVEVGSTDAGTVIAFDKRTGKQVWASTLKDEAGHTGGPGLMQIAGVPCIVLITQRNLVAIRLDKGKEGQTVALFPWVTDFANTIAGPAIHDDCVLVTAAYNQNTIVKVRLTLDGAKELWRKPYPSKVCTPVIHKNHIYVAWQKVRCLSWDTGELQWEGGIFSDPGSCIVTADNRLLVYGYNGKLALVETAERSPKKYDELAVRDKLFRAAAWPHLVLANERLLCRDREGNLACFRFTKE